MAFHVKKGDMVQIISGDQKGATGKILRVIPDKNRVVVQGHNIVHKHVRRSQQNPQGGRIQVEQPIHISNVQPLNKNSKPTRVRFEQGKDGSKKRVGLDGSELSVLKKKKS